MAYFVEGDHGGAFSGVGCAFGSFGYPKIAVYR
jgi:hypothetical protein